MKELRNTSKVFVVENGEEFKIGSYNGVSIIYRVNDGYINAGKLCRDAGKRIFNFTRRDKWEEIVGYWLKNEQDEVGSEKRQPLIELKKGYPTAKGIYIHPKLIHFVAEWISIEYHFKVARIMDLINEKNQILNHNLDDTINELTNQLNELKLKNSELNLKINQQSNQLNDESIRVKNNERRLLILKLKDDRYKLSADSERSDNEILEKHAATSIYKRFCFPSAMEFKRSMKNKFGCKYYIFPSQLQEVIKYIDDHNPKSKVEQIQNRVIDILF